MENWTDGADASLHPRPDGAGTRNVPAGVGRGRSRTGGGGGGATRRRAAPAGAAAANAARRHAPAQRQRSLHGTGGPTAAPPRFQPPPDAGRRPKRPDHPSAARAKDVKALSLHVP